MTEGRVSVTSGKKKASVHKETVAVSATKPKIVRKNQNTLPPHFPSQPPSRSRSVPRKRSIRGKSNHGSILRQPCKYYLWGTCTRTLYEYWHLPECQFFIQQKRVVSQETRVCFLITRLMNNQIKRRRKATSQKEEKVKAKTRMHSLLKERKSFGKARCRKSCTQFKEFDSQSPHYVTRLSRTRKDHRLEKYKSNLDISEVLTL